MDRNIITRADVESAAEQTVDLSAVVAQINQLEKRTVDAERAAKRRVPARRPLAWSAALVFIVLAVSVLLGWVAYLAF